MHEKKKKNTKNEKNTQKKKQNVEILAQIFLVSSEKA